MQNKLLLVIYLEDLNDEVDSVNFNSLPDLNRLINKLGIKTRYYIYKTRSRIAIKDLKKYYKKIGFVHPKKKDRLEKIIRGLNVGQRRSSKVF